MATYRYRAVRRDGSAVSGEVDAADQEEAVASLRRTGATPLTIVPAPAARAGTGQRGGNRNAAATMVGELAVLLNAGLQLDRALALAIENVEDQRIAARLAVILQDVREGAPLSRALARTPDLLSPAAIAMAEAGEANGRLGQALARLAESLEREAELRRLVGSAMIYPSALLVIAVGVVLLMLLFVVPQFESLFASSAQQLPAATVVVMGASRWLRESGLVLLLVLIGAGFGLRMLLRNPGVRLGFDRFLLRVPQLGELIRRIETTRFARTLGSLIESEVPVPAALALSQRTIANRVIANAIATVAIGVKEGGGLTAPLAASGALPRIAIGFLRTGEETSQLGLMLSRLADVLDRDVKLRVERLIGILTPAITVVLGATVASIIAAIMSAILGFNELAVS